MEGPKFQNEHLCLLDSTQLFAPSADQLNIGGPCDTDHPINYNTFCRGRDWDDPRGPERSVVGAESWTVSEDNPHQTWVKFIPQKQFTICTWPRDPALTADFLWIPVLRPAQRCSAVTF